MDIESRPETGLADAPAGAQRRAGGCRRWLILALAILIVASVAARCGGGDGRGGDARAPRMSLSADDLAAAHPPGARAAEDFRSVAPPVDIHSVERAARAASMGRLEMPSSRSLESWQDQVDGAQISQAVLVFESAEAAAEIESLAAPLLSNAFQLMSEPLTLEGVEDARLWSASGYAAVSFRMGEVLCFIGSDRADDPEQPLRLAEAARDRIRSMQRAATEAALQASPGAGTQVR